MWEGGLPWGWGGREKGPSLPLVGPHLWEQHFPYLVHASVWLVVCLVGLLADLVQWVGLELLRH